MRGVLAAWEDPPVGFALTGGLGNPPIKDFATISNFQKARGK